MIKTQIKQALEKELPGEKVQYEMAPSTRGRYNRNLDNGPRKGTVLVLLYKKNETLFFVLTERSKNLTNHKGQISLPGGAYEKKDKTLENAVIREVYEEVGVLIGNEDILGTLSRLYIPVSNFLVYPFVALYENKPEWSIDPNEVKQIIEVSLEQFLAMEPCIIKKTFKGKEIDVPYFLIDKKMVWGATAMILNEFKTIMRSILF